MKKNTKKLNVLVVFWSKKKQRYYFQKLSTLPENLDQPHLQEIAKKYDETTEAISMYDTDIMGSLPLEIQRATGKKKYTELSISHWQMLWGHMRTSIIAEQKQVAQTMKGGQ